MEHIEAAGVHSGDSACVIPPRSLDDDTLRRVREVTEEIASALDTVGLLNVQLAVQDGDVYVLEANPRSSRTVPFVSKATGVPIAKLAARVMAGETLADIDVSEGVPEQFSVKEVVLPFDRLPNSDPRLGPEMKSTGEVMGTASSPEMAYWKAQQAASNAPRRAARRSSTCRSRGTRTTSRSRRSKTSPRPSGAATSTSSSPTTARRSRRPSRRRFRTSRRSRPRRRCWRDSPTGTTTWTSCRSVTGRFATSAGGRTAASRPRPAYATASTTAPRRGRRRARTTVLSAPRGCCRRFGFVRGERVPRFSPHRSTGGTAVPSDAERRDDEDHGDCHADSGVLGGVEVGGERAHDGAEDGRVPLAERQFVRREDGLGHWFLVFRR